VKFLQIDLARGVRRVRAPRHLGRGHRARAAAHAQGTLRKRTFIGRKAVGVWAVAIMIQNLVGQLRAGAPRLSFARNMLEVELPLGPTTTRSPRRRCSTSDPSL
jgi:hypothetical protein